MTTALAFSLVSLVTATLAAVGTWRLSSLHLGALRREAISLDAIVQISQALEEANYETAVGAIAEWGLRYGVEFERQDGLGYFGRPPRLGKDWG